MLLALEKKSNRYLEKHRDKGKLRKDLVLNYEVNNMADVIDAVVPLVGLAIGAKIIENVLEDKPRKKRKKSNWEL